MHIPKMMPRPVPVQPRVERETSRERKAMWVSLKKSAKDIPSLSEFVEAHAD